MANEDIYPEYRLVAASQTTKVLGEVGGKGDYLGHIIIQPATTGAGAVSVFDGVVEVYTFTTGTLADLSPKTIPFNVRSATGAWNITTGANVKVTAFGEFS